jgi:hypothetical protein
MNQDWVIDMKATFEFKSVVFVYTPSILIWNLE